MIQDIYINTHNITLELLKLQDVSSEIKQKINLLNTEVKIRLDHLIKNPIKNKYLKYKQKYLALKNNIK